MKLKSEKLSSEGRIRIGRLGNVKNIRRAYENKEICNTCVTSMFILLRHLYLKSRRFQGDLGLRVKKTMLVKVKVKFILERAMKA